MVDQEWDELWINRIVLVQEAERQAALARTKQKIDDAKDSAQKGVEPSQ